MPSAPPARAQFAEITNSAAFGHIVLAHDALFAARFLPNRALDTALREAWRFQILTVAIHLHDTRDINDARSGLTVGRLQATLKGRSLASAGRIAAILKQLEAAGYLHGQASSIDRRLQILAPTPILLDAIRLWEEVMFSLIDLLAPGAGLAKDARSFPALGGLMRQHMVRARLAGWSPLDGFPDIALFATRDGGWRLLSRIAAMQVSGEHGPPGTPLEIDLQAFARETATSRSSLRRLLEDAFATGLMTGPPRNGRNILPSAALIEGFSTWLAMFIDAHRLYALAAREELGVTTAKRPA